MLMADRIARTGVEARSDVLDAVAAPTPGIALQAEPSPNVLGFNR
jgi:hypothetical protein